MKQQRKHRPKPRKLYSRDAAKRRRRVFWENAARTFVDKLLLTHEFVLEPERGWILRRKDVAAW